MNLKTQPIIWITTLNIFIFIISFIKINIKPININNNYILLPLTILVITFIISIALNTNISINIKTLLLKEIYQTRNVFTNNISTIQNYIYNWLVKIIIPVLIIYNLIKKKYLFATINIITLMYLFVISGNKSVYMTTMAMLFFYFIGKDYISKLKYFLLIIFISLLIFPLIDNYILNDNILVGTFVMRLLYTPALLTHYYFDFFDKNPILLFSENHPFNSIINSPYPKPIAIIISETYFNTSEMYANNGIISDGYMNLSQIGILINILLFSLLFLIFNSIKIDAHYYGIFFIYIFFILSTPLLTVLFTGGIWLLIILSLTLIKHSNKFI